MKRLRMFLFIVGLAPASSFAAVIDQSNLYKGPFVQSVRYFYSGSASLGQTFTVGLSGVLDSVALQMARDTQNSDQNVAVSIYSLAIGLPTGNPLAYTEFNAADSISIDLADPTTLVLDFSGFDINVSVGEQLAIVVSTFGNSVFWLLNGDSQGSYNPYASGEALEENIFGDWSLVSGPCSEDSCGEDFAFATYVTQVPLPAAFMLMFSGIVALAFAGRSSRFS